MKFIKLTVIDGFYHVASDAIVSVSDPSEPDLVQKSRVTTRSGDVVYVRETPAEILALIGGEASTPNNEVAAKMAHDLAVEIKATYENRANMTRYAILHNLGIINEHAAKLDAYLQEPHP